MNDKDKEAFDKWWISNKYELTPFYWHNTSLVGSEILATWQAACEYKRDEYLNIMKAMTQTSQNNFKLQDENKKLREALEFYADPENYIERYKDHWVHSTPCQKGDREFIKQYKHPGTEWIGTVGVGGKRAREALKEGNK